MSRTLAKRAAEALLGGDLAAPLVRLRGRSLILGYHNVVDAAEEAGADGSLHVPLERFRSHLDALERTHRLVPLDDLLASPAGPPRAALTFDDAYRGVLRHALPELARRGLPATLFVVPGHLGRGFWWDRVRGAPDALDRFRDHVLDDLAGDGDLALEAARERGLEVVEAPHTSRPADEAELLEATTRPGIGVGSHSWSHRNLAALARLDGAGREALDPWAEAELARPLAWLTERFPAERVSRWLAYPYGRFDARVEEALRAAGYRGGLRIEGGCLRPGDVARAASVPRINVPAGLGPRGLRLRAAGLL